jgi:aerobic-type carbon monoxide dehydrogenase small subunit (CoxS/CutS family)
MEIEIKFQLNGVDRAVRSDPRRPLLEVLREDLGLTGAKYGCGEGQCRACTVLINGSPTPSCLTPVAAVQNKTVRTIEGLAEGDQLHPVQQAFVEEDAMQCGYCVPGMILTATSLLERNPKASRGEIVDAMNGNLCRCCGYGNILKAVERAGRVIQEGRTR